jgi:tripartite-type tricarboxylate transporter receptor subunit TctC
MPLGLELLAAQTWGGGAMRIPAFVALLLLACAAQAQPWPSKPVRVVIPWPPGQATDIGTRLVGQRLQEVLGQPFVMDNKPGAGGAIGTDAVAKAAPDGYTLLGCSSGPMSVLPAVQKTSYDPLRDFAPLAIISASGYVLVTNPSFPAANAKELVAILRANPGKYSFSSSGAGATTHLIVVAFNAAAGIQATHVPYKGSVPALTDIMNGEIAYTIETVASTGAHIRAGRLRGYGLSTAAPSTAMPELPSLAEAAGLPGFDIGGWIGYCAPARTPRQIVARLSAEILRTMQGNQMRERFMNAGLEPAAIGADDAPVFIKRNIERYGEIAHAASIRID